MTCIVGVGQYRPRAVSVTDRQQELGLSDGELRRYRRAFGFDQICFDPELTEADLLTRAINDLADWPRWSGRVRHVLRPRTVRFTAPYPNDEVALACHRAGLTDARVVTLVDQACAGGLLAIDLAGALLERDGDPSALALVLMGEKTLIRGTQLIPGIGVLGEACVAVLVAPEGAEVPEHDRVLGYASACRPVPGAGLTMDEAAARAFGEHYQDHLREVVELALARAGLTASELDHYLPHNVSRLACDATARSLGIPRDRVFTANIGQVAHNWAADGFLNHATMVGAGLLLRGETYLLTSVGLGATYAAMVVRH